MKKLSMLALVLGLTLSSCAHHGKKACCQKDKQCKLKKEDCKKEGKQCKMKKKECCKKGDKKSEDKKEK